MNLIPSIKRCPCCNTLNFVRINGIIQDNPFKNLKSWEYKKKFICRKCKEEIGIFLNKSLDKPEIKVVWLNKLNIEESYFNKINLLKKHKNKLSKTQDDKYFKILKEIKELEDKMHSDQVKLKIKFKIQKKLISL